MEMPIESLNLLMLNVGYAEHHSDWNWKEVCSPFTRIYLVTEGKALLHLPSGVLPLKENHLYIIPAYTTHSCECNGKFYHYYLHVYEGFKNETDIFEIYDFPSEVKAEGNSHELFASMCRNHPEAALPASNPLSYDNNSSFSDYIRRYNDMPLYQKMQLRGSILMIFSTFMQYAKSRIWTKDERMSKVLSYIRANIYNDIDINNLASIACVSKPYLIRLFARNFNTSPLKYINRKKIERAQLALITENTPIREIAYSLGFTDDSYFIRLFKKMTGTTPRVYRERMKREE